MEEVKTPKDLVITVGVNDTTDEIFNYEMNELEALCEACNLEVITSFYQNLPAINNATYLGSGKLSELKNLIDTYQVELVVFLDELSPAQINNITKVLETEIMDRTMLILEIFNKRARTSEAKLQVEIANLKYMLPRLVGSYVHLSRTGGGGRGGVGARRGSGESKLELDKRHIESRINKLEEELKKVVLNRQNARKKRMTNEMKIVAFVGYTNAGKSTTINTLLSMFSKNLDENKTKTLYAEDMLFATLDTATRVVKLPTKEEFLLTDTVGFVNNLPHHLIESFKSTLEEIKEASLIVHVVDAASPYANLQITTTNQVLNALDATNIPMVYLLNKKDLVKNAIFLPKVDGDVIKISNITKEGFSSFISYLKEKLFNDQIKVQMLIPYDKGEVFNLLKEKAHINHFSYEENGILVDALVSKYLYNKYNDLIKN